MEQAQSYAQEMIDFLNRENAELRSSNRPHKDPAKLADEFKVLYLRHIAEHCHCSVSSVSQSRSNHAPA